MRVRGEVWRVVVVCGGLFLALSVTLGPPAADARGRDTEEAVRFTGVCEVPIRDSYDPHDLDNQVNCSEGRTLKPWLVTIRNASDVPVFVSEWYLDGRHGGTTILPKETKTLPLFSLVELWVGACWPGESPGTCQRGVPFRFASVEIVRWQDASDLKELWIRDFNRGVSTPDNSSSVAINSSEFTVELTWQDLGTNERGEHNYVTVPPKGRTQEIPPERGVAGRKALGNGEIARVWFAATGGGERPDLYRLVTPSERTGVPPFAVMTWLDGSWCRVTLHNLGPNFVKLQSWFIPYLSEGQNLALSVGQTGTFRLASGILFITGHVGTADTGEFTTLRATDWTKCAGAD